MKINEIVKTKIVKEEQLNELVWSPAATQGLVYLLGPTGAFWFMIAMIAGTIAAVAHVFDDRSYFQMLKDLVTKHDNKKLGKKSSPEDIKKLSDEVKSSLTTGQKSYATQIQNRAIQALKEKDYKLAGGLIKEIKNYKKKTDDLKTWMNRPEEVKRRKQQNIDARQRELDHPEDM